MQHIKDLMLKIWKLFRRGLASGIVIGGFGSGALVFAPTMNFLMSKFSQVPTFLGQSVELVTEGGRQFALHGGELQEVVYATASELAKLPYTGLVEGYYLVGTGSTGVGLAYATIGITYSALVITSSLALRRPHAGYKPDGWTPPLSADGGQGQGQHSLEGKSLPNHRGLVADQTDRLKQTRMIL